MFAVCFSGDEGDGTFFLYEILIYSISASNCIYDGCFFVIMKH